MYCNSQWCETHSINVASQHRPLFTHTLHHKLLTNWAALRPTAPLNTEWVIILGYNWSEYLWTVHIRVCVCVSQLSHTTQCTTVVIILTLYHLLHHLLLVTNMTASSTAIYWTVPVTCCTAAVERNINVHWQHTDVGQSSSPLTCWCLTRQIPVKLRRRTMRNLLWC